MRRLPLSYVVYALAAAGIVICSLLLAEDSPGSLACPTSGCRVVQSSGYAHVFGQPLALAGLLGYIAVAAAFAVPGWRGRVASAGLGVGGGAFALYLIGVQLFVIHAVCLWCVVTDTLTFTLAALICVRLVRLRDVG